MSALLQDANTTLELALEPIETHPAPVVRGAGAMAAMPAQQGPMGNALVFLQAGGTIDQLRDILALQRDWEAGEAKKAYVAAMARFKKNPPTILKDKRVYFENRDGVVAADYWHATLGNVADQVIAGLADVGISHSWKPERIDGRMHITCILTHELGHSESTTLDGALDNSGSKNPLQQMSSTTTYLSRYTLLLATGLAVKDEILPDDDGRSGGDAGAAPPPPPPPPPPPKQVATYPQADFEANTATWKGVIASGRKTPVELIAMVETKAPLSEDQKKVINSWNAA